MEEDLAEADVEVSAEDLPVALEANVCVLIVDIESLINWELRVMQKNAQNAGHQ